MRITPALLATEISPVVETKRWVEGRTFGPDRPLINVSQAAPADPPPTEMLRAMAETVLTDPGAHLYGPVLGHPALREALAARTRAIYGGEVGAANVAITQGCNHAFTAAIQTLAGPGDEVILPVPWYFNHKMWLDMTSVRTVPLFVGPDMVPDPQAARALITDRTRAIVLVTPNNPAGVEYPAATLAAFRDIAREAGVALIVDETYRDFHSGTGAPHDLFADPDWDDTLVHLYSFSKAFRLTGHRVGAAVAGQGLLSEMEKTLDTVAICAGQVGQRAALWGLTNLTQWLAGERDEILARRAAAERHLGALDGWRLRSAGAYFAWLEHPFDDRSDTVARRLVEDAGILALPGTAFAPADSDLARRGLRIAFANIDAGGLAVLADRLSTATI